MAGGSAVLDPDITRYLEVHQGMGFKFEEQARMLRLFADYARPLGDTHVKVDRVKDWCRTSKSQNVRRTRYQTVLNFSVFARCDDARHEVPPSGFFGRGRNKRPTPHIISADELQQILAAALELPPKGKISSFTYHYLFGLLAATGLRISEAVSLKRSDFVEEGLIVRSTKKQKERLVVIDQSTRDALNAYLARRDLLGADGDDLFVTIRGKAPHKVRAHIVFVRLARQLGLRGPTGTKGMRLHDLRHTFAVRSLQSCMSDSRSIANHMAALSEYLGHTDYSHTYWYLEATPTLLQQIAQNSEAKFERGI